MSKKYKCSNGHVFSSQSEYGVICPQCESDDVKPLQSNQSVIDKVKKFINENRVLSIAALIIIVFLISRCGRGDDDGVVEREKKFELSFKPFDDYIVAELSIYLYENGVEVDKELSSKNKLKNFTFKLSNGQEISFDDGIYYPCKSGDIQISWEAPEDFEMKSPNNIKVVNVELPNGPNEKASCPKEFQITKVDPLKNCKFRISSTVDDDNEIEVYYSINGENGDFKKQREYNGIRNYKYAIWGYCVYPSGEKSPIVSYMRNGDFAGFNCGISDADLSKIKSAFNALGNDLGSRTAINGFNNLRKGILPSDSKIHLNGKFYNPIEFYHLVKTIHKSNSNYKFNVSNIKGVNEKGGFFYSVEITVQEV